MTTLRDFVGLPYKSHGDDFTGVDCYSLYVLFNKHMLNKEIPDYTKLYATAHEHDDAAQAFEEGRKQWKTVTDNPAYGDMILFKERGVVTHCGVYLDGNDFLHIRENQTSTIEAFRGMAWERIMDGIIRWN